MDIYNAFVLLSDWLGDKLPQDLFFRTEDLRLDEVMDYYVETASDRRIVESLKGRSPVILKGSRGVGKSFLLRVAEAELKSEFQKSRILPVYLTFARAGLLRQSSIDFLPWMIAKISTSIKRTMTAYNITVPTSSSLALILGKDGENISGIPNLERVEREYEEFWKRDEAVPEAEYVPTPESLREAIEDLCEELGLVRITLLVDEAAHVFIPEQQRQFFTLMRDMRSPYVSVKAAVYPGATSYGESFQPTHDASVLNVDRSVTEDGYLSAMREIVLKQDPDRRPSLERNGEIFDTLAFAAMGNPRILLKTMARSTPLNRQRVQETIRGYFREEIWAEHSNLADRYPGHRALIDWGRTFLEQDVLPAIHGRNVEGRTEKSSAIWVHRDAPQVVREALRLLCYSGILQEGDSGIRATRREVGTRFLVNLGCNFAQDAEPLTYGLEVRRALSVRRMQEFGANHNTYMSIENVSLNSFDEEENVALQTRLGASIKHLDLTDFQKSKLRDDLGLSSIGDVLGAAEAHFKTAHYVGEVRARQMRNAAITAVIEYLSG